ncbi:diguanylate cyclase domain-containing protein [Noviherbaspirillum galbum]|uniref:Diguanylate cyclase n=1 Tax=Noviherbaspirillum galbum TaxID=2709383 RepID=A0A6B3SH05_9BURK|nr:diguanylate cyclase [Noviherbaspirillum galbum]NEX60157.1 diguanylate cyclase [Noviherbaspirillum galbum]
MLLFRAAYHKRLKTDLAWRFCGMSILLTLVTISVVEMTVTASLQEQIGQRLAAMAFQTADKLDQGMAERYREFELLAEQGNLGDPSEPLARKQQRLERIQKAYPYYAWIGVTDLQGRVLVDTKSLLTGVDVSKRPWFGGALAGTHIQDVHEAKLLAAKLPYAGSEPPRFVDVAFPYSGPDGKPAGVVGAHMSWNWAAQMQRDVLAVAGSPSVEGFIVSKDGTILVAPVGNIARPIPALDGSGNGTKGNGYRIQRWADTEEYLVGYATTRGHQAYPGLGWTVLVRQNVKSAFEPVRRTQQLIFWLGLGIALVFSAFGVLHARGLVAPLVALADGARRLRLGQAASLAPTNAHHVEVQELGSALTALVDDLQANQKTLRDLNASLENKVAKRTQALAASEERMRIITDNTPVLIAYLDAQQRFQFVNRTGAEWLELDRNAIEGRFAKDVLHEAAYAALAPSMDKALAGEHTTFEHSRPYQGKHQHLTTQFVPETDARGRVVGFFALAQDITDSKNYQLALKQDLLTDALTGLPNRTACLQEIQSAVARTRRSRKPFAVMFLDVDRFKQINDTYGHDAGDQVLIEFGRRLRQSVRDSDLVARLAGDEFLIIAQDVNDPVDDTVLIAQKVLDAMIDPLQVGQSEVHVTTSIGIVVGSSDDSDPAAIIKRADAAMYDAKRDGRNCYAFARHERNAVDVIDG